jgi:tetratricopeptide (TPR) repeat protein
MASEYIHHRSFWQKFFQSRTLRSGFRIPAAVASVCLAIGVQPVRAQVTPSPHQQAENFYQAGLAQVRSGHVDEAISAFKNGLALEPQDARLLDATGAAYSLKGDLGAARQYFVDSLRLDPDSVPTKQNLGITLFGLGRYEDASKRFREIQAVPGKPRIVASLFLGLIAQRQSDCKRALPLMAAAGNLLYQYPDAVLSFSECAYHEHDTKRADEALAAFEKLPGNTPSQSLQAADLYSRLGENEKALAALASADSSRSQTADVAVKHALLLEKMNRHEEAQKLLEDQSASQPTYDLLLLLAKIAKNRGDFAVAMKSLKRASELEPGGEDSYLEFSTICADHGNDQLALDSAEIGLDHVPDSYRLTVQKGVLQEKLGDLNEAEETLRKASGLQKDNSVALLSIAVVQAHGGRPEEAEKTLASAIRQFPDNYYMYYFQGKLLLNFVNSNSATDDLRESAKRSLEKAIQLNPEYADSYYQLSNVYLTSAPTLAERALHKCLQLDPNHIPAQYSLARLYVRTGRKAQGEALLARFKTQQRSDEMQQQKQLRIEVATN